MASAGDTTLACTSNIIVMPTTFYSSRGVWQEIQARLRHADRVHAAISYVGQGALKLLQLGRDDVLVVDMSLQAVAQGVTDPREVAKFMRRGVRVFSRRNLHAKFLLIDDVLFVGSANASRNSVTYLDEAAVMTTDRVARQSAEQALKQWCTEPVRPRYLKQCIAAYRPPRFKAAAEGRPQRRGQVTQPVRLWLIGGLRYGDVPEEERPRAEAAIARAEKMRRRPAQTEVDQVNYPSKLQLMSAMKPGDWAITCIRDSRGADVWAPQQLLSIESYPRQLGKQRWVVQFEAPKHRQSVRLTQFQQGVRGIMKKAPWNGRRTRPIRDDQVADSILRLWTQSGKPSLRKRKRAG
jgi:hypothetical protein